MNKEYRYQLESHRLTGHQPRKLTCPHCGRRKCLVRYVDTQDGFSYVDDTVGKCDHQQSCGYHYTPSQYFHDKPLLRPASVARRDLPPTPIYTPREHPLIALNPTLVEKSLSTQSTFWQWVVGTVAPLTGATAADLRLVSEQYCLGATRQSDTIFWQIDEQRRVHTGHIMQYGPDGHRLGYQSWVHYLLQQQGALPADYQPPKCFFGQHLLALRPDDHVALVESEKTAVVMALAQKQLVWLATAGCGGLTPEKTACLRGRRVLLFPDSGCLQKWRMQMELTEGISYTLSDLLESYPPNTDLADILLGSSGKT